MAINISSTDEMQLNLPKDRDKYIALQSVTKGNDQNKIINNVMAGALKVGAHLQSPQ